jgi:hypothetical protein
MIDISFFGLLGAIAGTLVAAVIYHLSIGSIDRYVRSRARLAADDRNRLTNELALLRRAVLTAELAICAGGGYWLAQRIWD